MHHPVVVLLITIKIKQLQTVVQQNVIQIPFIIVVQLNMFAVIMKLMKTDVEFKGVYNRLPLMIHFRKQK